MPLPAARAKPYGVASTKPECLRHVCEHGLGRRVGHAAGDDGAELGHLVVVRLHRAVPRRRLLVEVRRRVGGEILELAGDGVRDGADEVGSVPKVRVVAFGLARDLARIDDGRGRSAGVDGPTGPRVVAEPIHDDEVGIGERGEVGGRRLVVVGIDRRAADDRRHVAARPGEVADEVAPLPDGDDDPHRLDRTVARGCGRTSALSTGGEQDRAGGSTRGHRCADPPPDPAASREHE